MICTSHFHIFRHNASFNELYGDSQKPEHVLYMFEIMESVEYYPSSWYMNMDIWGAKKCLVGGSEVLLTFLSFELRHL